MGTSQVKLVLVAPCGQHLFVDSVMRIFLTKILSVKDNPYSCALIISLLDLFFLSIVEATRLSTKAFIRGISETKIENI